VKYIDYAIYGKLVIQPPYDDFIAILAKAKENDERFIFDINGVTGDD
jgi:hypothetical protein